MVNECHEFVLDSDTNLKQMTVHGGAELTAEDVMMFVLKYRFCGYGYVCLAVVFACKKLLCLLTSKHSSANVHYTK